MNLIHSVDLGLSQRSIPQNKVRKKPELVFIKHYAPHSLPLTVNSHHVLLVKRLLFLCFIRNFQRAIR